MAEMDIDQIKKIAHTISEFSHLNETDTWILLSLMENGKISKADLARMLEYKNGNSAAYHTRAMEEEGVISRYTIVPNWKKVGLATEFVILAETENEEQLLEIEKKHVIMADEYASSVGDVVVTPTISGCVILQDVYHCFGDKTMAIIIGRATSDQDAAVYCKNYLVVRYPDIKVSLLINKYRTISDFFIDKQALHKLKEIFQIKKAGETAETLEMLHGISSGK
ncbi:MAG: hypothetical protein JXA98_08120 [Methanosarcinaceae archaeon]|nr:hypothetical protein [Methanosarcinaceae archaeon]